MRITDAPARHRKGIVTAGIALSAVLMLSACGGSSSGTASAGASSATSGTSGAAVPAVAAALTPVAERSQLKIAMPDLGATEDPIQASNLVDVQVMDLLGGNLFRLSLNGKTAMPSLASAGTYSDNDTVLTV